MEGWQAPPSPHAHNLYCLCFHLKYQSSANDFKHCSASDYVFFSLTRNVHLCAIALTTADIPVDEIRRPPLNNWEL